MPYITRKNRNEIEPVLNPLLEQIKQGKFDSPGEINYMLTRIIKTVLLDRPNYCGFNEMIGVLDCAKLELYRRMVAKYEDKKIQENGDIY